jgi:hypothetical protein
MTSRRADRRTEKRVLARLHPTVPGRVNFTAGEIEGGGMILDISAGGANVHEASHRLEPGTKVEHQGRALLPPAEDRAADSR